MGNGISKVNCGDIALSKKHQKHNSRRPTIRIDKSLIGKPTDFRHTYPVGNTSPTAEEFLDGPNSKEHANELMATMAQITDALKKFPLHTTKKNRPSPKINKFITSPLLSVDRINGSHSDQQISRHRPFRPAPFHPKGSIVETSSSMIIDPLKFKEDFTARPNREGESLNPSTALSQSKTNDEENISTMDLTGGYYDFSSCLQSRVDAQIIEIARARSKNKGVRSPQSNNHLLRDMPTIMI